MFDHLFSYEVSDDPGIATVYPFSIRLYDVITKVEFGGYPKGSYFAWLEINVEKMNITVPECASPYLRTFDLYVTIGAEVL